MKCTRRYTSIRYAVCCRAYFLGIKVVALQDAFDMNSVSEKKIKKNLNIQVQFILSKINIMKFFFFTSPTQTHNTRVKAKCIHIT